MRISTLVLGLLASIARADTGPQPAGSGPLPIDLPAVLRLAGAQNIDVQIAQAKVYEARAQHLEAQLRFFPWIGASLGFRRHEGNIQRVDGNVFETNKNTYATGGAVNLGLELGESIFGALAAHRLASAAGEDLEAERRDRVLEAAVGYFELARARAAVGIGEETLRVARDYAAQVRHAAETGIAFKGDAFRAEAQAERDAMALRRARERQRTAAARLSRVLRLDPAVEISVREADLVPLSVDEAGAPLSALIAAALEGRPELRASGLRLDAAEKAKDGAVYGPMFPSISGQAYYGGLGGGTGDPGPKEFEENREYSVNLGWRVGPGGLFDAGRIGAARARVDRGEFEMEKARDEIRRQVVEAHARAASLRDQVEIARRALEAAREVFRLTDERREFGVGAVLEHIQSHQDLDRAMLDYANAVAELNGAQYALRWASGR
ncbi:MAG: TolC family protein [Verrucomicrobiae bacterium]|nr:TolC family protein [Verrucomicrobiae bacterium]